MASHFASGFADELTKVAKISALRSFAHRLNTSKDLRDAIRRSATLGAGTGAITAALGDGEDASLVRALKGGAIGALGGGITGATFPGWFGRSNMMAADEIPSKKLFRGRRR